jgi:alpha-amylase
VWEGTFQVSTPGDYQYKVAINNSWDINYGAGGAAGGADIPTNIPAGISRVTFVWDQVSHIVTHKLNN